MNWGSGLASLKGKKFWAKNLSKMVEKTDSPASACLYHTKQSTVDRFAQILVFAEWLVRTYRQGQISKWGASFLKRDGDT